MNEVIDMIRDFGFPIGMCLLIYMDLRKKIEDMISVLRENNQILKDIKVLGS